MKILLFNKKVLLRCFITVTFVSWGFVTLHKQQLTIDMNEAIQRQNILQTLLANATAITQKIKYENNIQNTAIQQGFFKKLRPRELKKIITDSALTCHISEIFIKLNALKYNIPTIISMPLKLVLETALDEDVFQFIDTLQQQNIGLIDIKELNIFRKPDGLSEHTVLNAEIYIDILNYCEQSK